MYINELYFFSLLALVAWFNGAWTQIDNCSLHIQKWKLERMKTTTIRAWWYK